MILRKAADIAQRFYKTYRSWPGKDAVQSRERLNKLAEQYVLISAKRSSSKTRLIEGYILVLKQILLLEGEYSWYKSKLEEGRFYDISELQGCKTLPALLKKTVAFFNTKDPVLLFDDKLQKYEELACQVQKREEQQLFKTTLPIRTE